MMAVRDKLPTAIRERMETEKYIFSNILKQFAMQGCWDFYWGAFYPKGGKRTEDAQLFLWINRHELGYGFYIGEYGSDQRNRFLRNCRENYDVLVRVIDEYVPAGELLFFGEREEFVGRPGDADSDRPRPSFRDWFRDPAEAGIRAAVSLPKGGVLQQSQAQLAQEIADLFQGLFPLFLLAALDNPMPAIGDYLGWVEPPETNPEYPLASCAEDTGFEEAVLARWVRAVERKGQAIIYGPPGTGKTYVAEHLARHLVGGGDGFYDVVQFHPAYAYEDFVQGIRPKPKADGWPDYPMVPGRFLEFCEEVKNRQGRCVLIIDEINRANLARVFGELMYLLEYRNREVPLAGGGSLRIPTNVRIIGTMNTADRSIALVDHALRRRFAFLALYPNYDLLRTYHQRTGFDVEPLIAVLRRLNRQIGDRHYEVGITFFLREDLTYQIEDIWTMEIEPYLEEYFFDQQDKVDAFRWEQVGREILS
ncbi:MAG: AAA family ATPase [Anaerolineae bacterium]|nr:AAA family ATPase [Anaerolineae bacterium]